MGVLERLNRWLDVRLGHRRWWGAWRARTLPASPSWWLTSGSLVFWLLVIEVATGLLLMASYSPSLATAWASVSYIERTAAGSFLRGVHYYTAQALIVALLVHLIRVVACGIFRAPRELIWVTGLLSLPLVLTWAMTGNPLSGSQQGLAQVAVEAQIVGSTPGVGPTLSRLLLGGEEVGHLTLVRLYFLHVAVVPLAAAALLALHISQVLRHGLAPRENNQQLSAPVPYWPYQSVRNMAVLALVVGIIALLAWRYGAPLGAPADPDLPHHPRPEWYFRALFELRRHFTGEQELIATLLIPTAVLLIFLTFPLWDGLFGRRTASLLRTSTLLAGLAGWGWLTGMSYHRDLHDGEYQASRKQDRIWAERARVLAARGVPPTGPAELLRNDPQTQGPLLFARHCATCHPWLDKHGQGLAASEASAPNLYGFGSRQWIEGLLDPERIASDHYFGRTAFAEGEMVSAVQELAAGLEGDELSARRKQLRLAAEALAAEARPPQAPPEARRAAAGRVLIAGELGCTGCHRFHSEGELGTAPDLTGYGSRSWLVAFISDPRHDRFYGERNDRMPAFAPGPDDARNLLSQRELALLADWLISQQTAPSDAPRPTPGAAPQLTSR